MQPLGAAVLLTPCTLRCLVGAHCQRRRLCLHGFAESLINKLAYGAHARPVLVSHLQKCENLHGLVQLRCSQARLQEAREEVATVHLGQQGLGVSTAIESYVPSKRTKVRRSG